MDLNRVRVDIDREFVERECLGCTDLTERDEHGEPQLIMQADQSVYLHPARATLPRPVLTIGEHDVPDVALEVDHTTDARRRKLGQYEAWGFPEVWIEVPEARTASRPRSRRSALTIYLLVDGAYRTSAASRAFPGWTAVEIHAALNEETFSAEKSAVLERVGGSARGAGRHRPGRRPAAGRAAASEPGGGSCGRPRRTGAGAVGSTRNRGLGRVPRRARLRRVARRRPLSRPPPPASARPTSASVCSTGSQAAQLLQRLVRNADRRTALRGDRVIIFRLKVTDLPRATTAPSTRSCCA